MNIPSVTRFIGDEDPLQIWWTISGALVNFTSGYTFTLKLALESTPATVIFTKTTGFTGAAGSGTAQDGTPNLTVAWATTGELNDLTREKAYRLEIVALKTSDNSQSTLQMTLNMKKRLGS